MLLQFMAPDDGIVLRFWFSEYSLPIIYFLVNIIDCYKFLYCKSVRYWRWTTYNPIPLWVWCRGKIFVARSIWQVLGFPGWSISPYDTNVASKKSSTAYMPIHQKPLQWNGSANHAQPGMKASLTKGAKRQQLRRELSVFLAKYSLR